MTDLSKLGLTAGSDLTGSIPEGVWPRKMGDPTPGLGLMYPGTLGFVAGPTT
jgi:hypothetical protein